MKKIFNLMLVAMVMLVAACENDAMDSVKGEGESLSFYAEIAGDTKAYIDDADGDKTWNTIWEEGDILEVSTNGTDVYDFKYDGEKFTCSEDGVNSLIGETVTIISKYEDRNSYAGKQGWGINGTQVENFSANSTITFEAFTSYFRYTYNGDSDITFTVKVEGENPPLVFQDGKLGFFDEITISGVKGENFIPFWTQNTEPVNATISYTIDGVVCKEKATTLSLGKVYNLGTLEAPAAEDVFVENAWNLITNANQLKVGQKIIVAANTANYAISTTQNSNNRGIAPIAKDGTTAIVRDDVQVFTVEAGTEDNTWAFKATTGYIYAASSSSNQLKTSSYVDANASWSVSINTTSGVATIVAKGANTRNTLQYNADSGLFSCYASASQGAVSIYCWYGADEPAISQRVALDTPTNITAKVTIDEEEATNSVSFTWDAVNNADSYTVSVGAATTTVKTTTATLADLGWNTTHTVNVVANASATSMEYKNSVAGTATFEIGAKPTTGNVELGASYSYTFTSKVFTANGTKKLSSLNWTLAGVGGDYWGWDSNGKGQQFGSGSKYYTSMTLSTSDYEGGVKTIKINTSGASSTNAKLKVFVGGVQIGNEVSLTSSAKEYTFESDVLLSGKIEFAYTQTSKKALYIKSIAIN